jgi:hypothetical protein
VILSLGTEKDIALREKYAWEFLSTTTEQEYDKDRESSLSFGQDILAERFRNKSGR